MVWLSYWATTELIKGQGQAFLQKVGECGSFSNVAEEEIAKQFPTERREMIFCAMHMTEKWPFFAYDDRKMAVLVLDVYWRQHFFFSRKPNFFVYNFNTATHGAN
jgi:hypothetical protein